jgi:hypothetical protein
MIQMRQRMRALLPLILTIVGIVLFLLLGSPLILVIVDSLLQLRWDRLTEIGQSYTGIAALLSGAALVGVVYSIRLQTQQISVARGQAVREMQFGLLRLAMDDPSLEMMWKSDAQADPAEYRRRVYRTQMFRYLEFAYMSGELDDSMLRSALTNEVFVDAEARRQWTAVRLMWLSALPAGSRRMHRRFLQILDESCATAEESAAAEESVASGSGGE